MTSFDPEFIAQIIYALERQEAVLDAHADALLHAHDYNAEFPASDAARLREAVDILRTLPTTHRLPERKRIMVPLRTIPTPANGFGQPVSVHVANAVGLLASYTPDDLITAPVLDALLSYADLEAIALDKANSEGAEPLDLRIAIRAMNGLAALIEQLNAQASNPILGAAATLYRVAAGQLWATDVGIPASKACGGIGECTALTASECCSRGLRADDVNRDEQAHAGSQRFDSFGAVGECRHG